MSTAAVSLAAGKVPDRLRSLRWTTALVVSQSPLDESRPSGPIETQTPLGDQVPL